MASKTIDHLTMTVSVTPYEHEGMQYDALLTIVAYHKGRGFCVSWQPVKLTGYGYQTGPMPSQDPLVGGKGFVVKEAKRNDATFLKAMRDRLTEAEEGIRYLFDQRDYDRLKVFMATVAEFGYYDDLKAGMAELINNNTNNKKSSETMATKKMNEKRNAAQQQVTDEIAGVSVGEMTLDAIQPVMVPVEGSEYQVKGDDGKAASEREQSGAGSSYAEREQARPEVKQVTFESMAPNIGSEDKAVTMPLGQHGTLVIGGVPKREESKPKVTLKRKVTLKTKTPETSNMEPETSLSAVTLVTYTTKRGETAPRIIGFSGEDDPRWKPIYDEKQALVAEYTKAKKKDPKAKMTSSPFGPAWLTDREGSGEKQYCMTFGVRYMDVARKLCEAYNTTDRDAWKQAEQAVRQTKQGIVSDYQAEKAARRAEREAKKAAQDLKPANLKPETKVYTEQEVADLMQRVLKGDAQALAQVNTMLKAA